ncbi:DUF397 domain-containing protein [Kitasatospora sp. NPDC057692]|uniref:DUF397 domain-containing protein n=1 Tax=Kitasatospora sp. NPDC057692 TaxID=3346215 RepID=UPI003685A883
MSGIEWQKSTFSGSGGDCVEVRAVGRSVQIRESDAADQIIQTTPQKFAEFLQDIKAGEFNQQADQSI